MKSRSYEVMLLLMPACMGMEERHGVEVSVLRVPTEAMNKEYDGNFSEAVSDSLEMPIFAVHPNGKRVKVWDEEEDKTGEYKKLFVPRVEAMIKGSAT